MYQFDKGDEKSKKESYIEMTLKKKFASEFETFGNDFINDVAMKMDIRGINMELLFIAYLCHENTSIRKLEFEPSIIRKKLNEYDKINVWYNMLKNKDYSIDKFYEDILMYLIMVIKYMKYSEENYEFNVPDEDIEIY